MTQEPGVDICTKRTFTGMMRTTKGIRCLLPAVLLLVSIVDCENLALARAQNRSKQYDIRKQLRYFETMKTSDFVVRTRERRTAGDVKVVKEISFTALGRAFQLVLEAGSPVLQSIVDAEAVDWDGKRTPFRVNPYDFFTGHLADDTAVDVDAHYEDGVLCCTIYSSDDVYVTEPAWRYLPESDNHSVLAYRSSDVIWNNVTHPPPAQMFRRHWNQQKYQSTADHFADGTSRGIHLERDKRRGSTPFDPRKNTCQMLLKADFLFFRDFADRNIMVAAQVMIGTLQTSDRIFRQTVWNQSTGLTGFGLFVGKVEVYTNFTTNDPYSFNRNNSAWTRTTKLMDFSLDMGICRFCLAHLFTTFAFEKAVGLSFMANPSPEVMGGICSSQITSSLNPSLDFHMCPRTGWTSTKDTESNTLLQIRRHLVTTHEIGHSWGAAHDPRPRPRGPSPCGQTDREGGSFLLFPDVMDGRRPNNQKFSPCSKRSILRVLTSKSSVCFTEKPVQFCGNGKVEPEQGEECDVGLQLYRGNAVIRDPCCTENCRLRDAANCSDFNHACCLKCQVAPAGLICFHRLDLKCKDDAFCDGKSHSCPEQPPLPDGTPCLDEGRCSKGVCESLCQTEGRKRGTRLVPCHCTQNATAACLRCCVKVKNKSEDTEEECVPLSSHHRHQANRPCFMGQCNQEGECVPRTTLAARLSSFFGPYNQNSTGEFLKSNVVAVVLVVSLVICIPASCIASYLGRKRETERETTRSSEITEIHRFSAVAIGGSEATSPRDRASLQHLADGDTERPVPAESPRVLRSME